jgi:hypothetical protein
MSVAVLRRHSRWLGRSLGLVFVGLAFCVAGSLPGCVSSYENELVGTNGTIDLEDITSILNDTGMDTAQQRQALRDLGITDEDLIDSLLRGL